ncbi:orotidine-5'-phosphate decarboxylase [bacterium]|nr:orotidine-5'-phosphate decarboxylase [bacterium]
MSFESPIIVALDLSERERAILYVEELKDLVAGFKVGLELIHFAGFRIIEEIRRRGGRVFYDGKFHDIPNTVARAAKACVSLGVWMFNIHSLGGREMMVETVKAVKEEGERLGVKPPLVLAVTILTSLDREGLREMGIDLEVDEMVGNLASLAKECGCDGVVCSPREIELVREKCGEDFLVVCPGIRWEEGVEDHRRFASPKWALDRGANYLVIGRPILRAESPRKTLFKILEEIRSI